MALSRRFINDGMPEGRLDPVQERAKEKLIADMASGRIVFEKNLCLCGEPSSNALEISGKDFHGLPLGVYLCKQCALMYCDPYMDLKSSGIFYREYYRDLYEGERILTVSERFDIQYREGKDIIRFLESRIPMEGMKRVYEVGSATGGLLEAFRERSFEVTGIDLDDRYMDFGRARGLRLISSSLEDMVATTNEKYNLVIICHVFEHMHDPLGVLRLIKKILSPQGVVFIEVPNMDLSYIELSQFQLAHKWYFDKVTIGDVLERGGFQTVASVVDAHLRVIGRHKEGQSIVVPPCRADYARWKFKLGRWFERMLPVLRLIRALRLNKPVKYLYGFFLKIRHSMFSSMP